jgi:hypothetical protein
MHGETSKELLAPRNNKQNHVRHSGYADFEH